MLLLQRNMRGNFELCKNKNYTCWYNILHPTSIIHRVLSVGRLFIYLFAETFFSCCHFLIIPILILLLLLYVIIYYSVNNIHWNTLFKFDIVKLHGNNNNYALHVFVRCMFCILIIWWFRRNTFYDVNCIRDKKKKKKI